METKTYLESVYSPLYERDLWEREDIKELMDFYNTLEEKEREED